jgi:YfiR/HmsC-like
VKVIWQIVASGLFSLIAAGLGYERVSFAASPEYQVKAAFLLNFMKFVEWPGAAFTDEKSPLVLGVMGEDPFGGALDALEGQIVKNRVVQVKRLSNTDGIRKCHLLYLSTSEEGRIRDIVSAIGDAPVLTVSDGLERFAQQGVSINFILSDNKIRFEINVTVAKKASLSMGTQLLQVAKVVEGG